LFQKSRLTGRALSWGSDQYCTDSFVRVPEVLKLPTLEKLFILAACGLRNLGIVVQDHIQQGIVDLQIAVVSDESQLAELVMKTLEAIAQAQRSIPGRRRPQGADPIGNRAPAEGGVRSSTASA
jgi:hypothetical protein